MRVIGDLFLIWQHLGWQRQYQKYRNKYSLSKDFGFNGYGIKMYGDGDIVALEKSYISSYSILDVNKGYAIEIGRNCAIADGVRMSTCNGFSNGSIGCIIIEDGCFIGSHSYIRENVHLGKNCVVGANSVVTRSFPKNCVIAGNPARFVKKRNNKLVRT
jgi:maltose O-acetyltransferase